MFRNWKNNIGKLLAFKWKEVNGEVIIQMNEVKTNIGMYYPVIKLGSGSKIAVKLGRPDVEGKFKIKNTFGKFSNIFFSY